MNNSDKGLKQFVKNTIEQYKDSIRVDEWLDNIPIDESKIDHTFTQIAIRPQIEEEVFRLDNDIHPGIFGLERPIILGEIRFFVKELLKRKSGDNTLFITKEELTPGTLANYIEDSEVSIILEDKILYGEWLKNPAWLKNIDIFSKKLEFQKESPLISISSKLVPDMKNVIILNSPYFTKWKYGIYKNEYTTKENRLFIQIGEIENGRRDVIIKTVNKIDPVYPNIKFIEWEE